MAKKMLIDASHAEETRVVIVSGNEIEEFDFESINKKQIAGNVYLAKVTRVEPSLQAAFVDYGGNRHGFLAFSEIHPDYYQISKKDRAELVVAEAAYQRYRGESGDSSVAETGRAEKSSRSKGRRVSRRGSSGRSKSTSEILVTLEDGTSAELSVPGKPRPPKNAGGNAGNVVSSFSLEDGTSATLSDETRSNPANRSRSGPSVEAAFELEDGTAVELIKPGPRRKSRYRQRSRSRYKHAATASEEVIQSEELETQTAAPGRDDTQQSENSQNASRHYHQLLRKYKIQDVIKKKQILLIQVVKEERGNKGAALTTYMSLAGRYCVLMPNTGRGGGISRKITNLPDRKRLKEITNDMEVPQGMGLIVRTAGANRTKAEIQRDYEYLLRQWDIIRTDTLQSIAPSLIFEEGNLIKKSIRDLYTKDIDNILVEGEDGYQQAKEFMAMLMPDQAKRIQHYHDKTPLFIHNQVEGALSDMIHPVVQLKSGGYIVIGITEALVAIDVNSGRSTKEGSVEETALKTNLEAANEIARQLRLRDLAGLIVIDFIDMDEPKNNRAVEKRLAAALKQDRARLQIGRISSFGLLEMSRQRLRPGMLETITTVCPHCHGEGTIRSDESLALAILRAVEEEALRRNTALLTVQMPVQVANYLMNYKRDRLSSIEQRYGVPVFIESVPDLVSPEYHIERSKELPENYTLPTRNTHSPRSEADEEPEAKSESKSSRPRNARPRKSSEAAPKEPAPASMRVIDLDEDAQPAAAAPAEENSEGKKTTKRSDNSKRRSSKAKADAGPAKAKADAGPAKAKADAGPAFVEDLPLERPDALDVALEDVFAPVGTAADLEANGSESDPAPAPERESPKPTPKKTATRRGWWSRSK